MKAVVTGAAGFIGSTLVERLLADGFDVAGVDAFTDYYSRDLKLSNISAACRNPRFTLIDEDLCGVKLASIFEGATYIFHQAGQPGVRKSWGDEFDVYVRQNIQATQRVLEACRGNSSIERIVYASSSSVYGDAERFPTAEDVAPAPMSPYGASKLAAEHLVSLYARNFDLPTTSLRYFTVYGARQRPDMAFTRFLYAASAGSPITIFGSGEQVRDFTYVDDIVEANILAAAARHDAGRVFNVSGGTSISLNAVLDHIEGLMSRPLDVRRVEPARGDVPRTGGATARIEDELRWSPSTTLEEGLAVQLEWVRESRYLWDAIASNTA